MSGEATTEPRARDDAIIPEEEKVGALAVSSTPEIVSCFHSFQAGMSIACPRYSRTRWRHNPRFFVTLNTIICFAAKIGTAMKKFYLEDWCPKATNGMENRIEATNSCHWVNTLNIGSGSIGVVVVTNRSRGR